MSITIVYVQLMLCGIERYQTMLKTYSNNISMKITLRLVLLQNTETICMKPASIEDFTYKMADRSIVPDYVWVFHFHTQDIVAK